MLVIIFMVETVHYPGQILRNLCLSSNFSQEQQFVADNFSLQIIPNALTMWLRHHIPLITK